MLQPEQEHTAHLDQPVELELQWWLEGDDYAVRITDHTSGTSGHSVREVFADAVDDAYLQVICS